MAAREQLVESLQGAFSPGGRHAQFGATVEQGIDMPALYVPAANVYTAIETLKTDPAFRFDQLSYLTATDELNPQEDDDDEDAGAAGDRFRIVYFLMSVATGTRLKVHTTVPQSDRAVVRSLVSMYLGANWMEREVFDMFGIVFGGHPDLRRILMPEEYTHFPLRKDFPLEGIEPDRLYRTWERARNEQSGSESEL